MKYTCLFALLFTVNTVFSQSKQEAAVLQLSKNIFTWEVENKISLIEPILHDQFSVVNSRGEVQTKDQYLKVLNGGNFSHDSIAVEQSRITLVQQTATITGKGWFHMTVSGNKVHRHLSFMEVFVRQKKQWKMIALYASVIPE